MSWARPVNDVENANVMSNAPASNPATTHYLGGNTPRAASMIGGVLAAVLGGEIDVDATLRAISAAAQAASCLK